WATVVIISRNPLSYTHVQRVQKTGRTHTRHSLRFNPVAASCVTNIPEIQAFCRPVFESFLGEGGEQKFTYKIELRIRNHTTITRPNLIQAIADCLSILVEVFKLNKFIVVEIARTHTSEHAEITRME
ncbi:hypothetical protein DFH07DRAFT_861351, partial [Mycena maculata]